MKNKASNFILIAAVVIFIVIAIIFYYASIGKINWMKTDDDESHFEEERKNLEEEISNLSNRLSKLEKHISKKIELKRRLDRYVNITYGLIKMILCLLIISIESYLIYKFYSPQWMNTLDDVMNLNGAVLLFLTFLSLVFYGKPASILNVFNAAYVWAEYYIKSKFEHHLESIVTNENELSILEKRKKDLEKRMNELKH